VGSLITITSFSYDMLLLGRAIQGIGAGGLFPIANAFIGDIFPQINVAEPLGY
jgi:MFS family permease